MTQPSEDKDVLENLIRSVLTQLEYSEKNNSDSFESYHFHLQRNLYSTEKEYIDHFLKGYDCLINTQDV